MPHISGRAGLITFLSGAGCSLIGNRMAGIALPWYVLETTGSPSRTGLVSVATVLPMFLSGLLGGTLVDRLGGRRMSMLSDIVSGLAILAIPLADRAGVLTFPLLLALVFVGAMLDIPGVTAQRTLLPRFAKQNDLAPETVYSWYEMLTGLAGIAGPAVAGALIATIGPVGLLWLDGSSFLLSAATVGIAAEAREGSGEPAHRTGYLQDVRDGLRFLTGDRLLFSLALVFGLTNMVSWAFWGVAMPVRFFHETGSASRLGVVISATSVGALLGTAAFAAWGPRWRKHRRLAIVGAFVVMIPSYIGMAWFPNQFVLILSAALMGFLGGPLNPISVAVRMERIPVHLRGRVFAGFSAFTAVVSPIGPAVAGPVIELIGIGPTMWGCALLYAVIVSVTPFLRSWRDMEVSEP